MAQGFVAGFVKWNDQWVGHWVRIDARHKQRVSMLNEARAEIAKKLAHFAGGEAVARRNMILIDGMAPNGREFLEVMFAALRMHEQPEST